MPASRLDIGQLTKDALSDVFKNLQPYLKRYLTLGLLLIISCTLTAIASADIKPPVPGVSTMPTIDHPAIDGLAGLVGFVMMVAIITRYFTLRFRELLAGETPEKATFAFGTREWNMIITGLKIFGLVAGVMVAAGVAAFAFKVVLGPVGAWLGFLMILAGGAATIWISTRLTLAMNSSALDAPKPLKDSYDLTQGYFWPILGGGLVLGLVSFGLSLVVGIVGGIVAGIIGLVLPFTVPVIKGALQAFVMLVSWGLYTHYQSGIYRVVKGS